MPKMTKDEAAKKIVEILMQFDTDAERWEVLRKVDDDVCVECGSTLCEGWCQGDPED